MSRQSSRWRDAGSRLPLVFATLLLGSIIAAAAPTPKPHSSKAARKPDPVTDANVADRVLAARTKKDHDALAAYYTEKASAEAPRIAHFEQLLRAYMHLEGKPNQSLQQQARLLLKGVRMSQKHYMLLAEAHRTMGAKIDDSQ